MTGSCAYGRDYFFKDKGLSMGGKSTVKNFIDLTENTYGGEIIKKLLE